jgi:hypothetical protein
MGIVVDVPQAGIDYLIYGDNNATVGNYIQTQLANIPRALNDFGHKVYNTMVNSYNYITDNMRKHAILSNIKQSGVQIAHDPFSCLMSFTDLQNANPTMQRWVMAHKEVKELFNNQNLDGYSGSYVNLSGNTSGEDDYNYRRVMDGVVYDTADQGSMVKFYYEDLLPGDKPLDTHSKLSVLHTWDTISYILDTCDFDFTCSSTDPVKINKE